MEINPPKNKLTPHVRRDTVSYPYIEAIMQWAEHVCGQRFNETDIWGDSHTDSYIQAHGKNLYTMIKTLPDDRIEYIKELANQLDYPLTDIEPFETKDIHKILFYEKGVNRVLFDSDLSKGMFRTLHLIIYLEYLIQQDCPSLLLIDDVCEGLDYNRSTQLGKYLFQRCEEQDIQLIASSNDSFLMNAVDTRYWNILFRQGSEVFSINYLTHPQLFDEFVYTGLSNFDLFSSDYIDRYCQIMNKRKIALFVEGQGELIFLREFLFRWYQFDTNRVGVTCYSLQAQRFNPVPYPIGDEQSKIFSRLSM